MKRSLSIGVLALLFLLLAGCSANRNYFTKANRAMEPWHREMAINPRLWVKGADRWFMTGYPAPVKLVRRPSYNASISVTRLPLSDKVSDILVHGGFRTQIFGTPLHNSLYIYGPNFAKQFIGVKIRGDQLDVFQTEPIPPEIMNRVVIRIGVRKLKKLTHKGSGQVELVNIFSRDLCVSATRSSTGNLYLKGRFNLKKVMHAGHGSVNIFGAQTPYLDVETYGSGDLNIVGNVGVQSIVHRGSSNINIVGANSNSLRVDAKGAGQIAVKGIVNLKSVEATDNTRVFVAATDSTRLHVLASQKARVGIAGCAKNLDVSTFDDARFEGRELCAQNAFVRASGCSHINVTAANKAFTAASDESSIYFYGPANLVTSFTRNYAVIIPVETPTWCNINSEFRSYSYTLSHGRDTIAYAYLPSERKVYQRRVVRRPSTYIK